MAGPKTAPVEPKIADRLLDLLSTDDLFREAFQRDPLRTLRWIGHASPATPGQLEPFAECRVNVLASKEAIAAAREEIRLMLVAGLNYTTPKLDLGDSTERLLIK